MNTPIGNVDAMFGLATVLASLPPLYLNLTLELLAVPATSLRTLATILHQRRNADDGKYSRDWRDFVDQLAAKSDGLPLKQWSYDD